MEIIAEIIEGVVTATTDGIYHCLKTLFLPDKKTKLDASFMENPGEIVKSTNRGFTVNGLKFLSEENSYKNQITYGGTGAGKTSNILIPQILNSLKHSSMVVNDPSGEIAKVVAKPAEKAGSRVLIFNPAKCEISELYSPLARVKTIKDSQQVAQLFLLNLENKGSDPFWQISASNIMSICFRLLAFHSPKELCTVQNALRILEELSYGNKVDKLIVATKDQALISAYKSFIANDKKLANSILATAKASLTLFQEESVIRATAGDTLDFSSFRKERTILFINNNIANTKYYAPLTCVMLQQFFNELMEELPPPGSLPVYFHIEESASVTFSGMPLLIANCRKYGIGTALFYQSFHQMSHQYSAQEAKSVEANCWTKIYLPGTPIDIAASLEKEMGVFEWLTEENVRRTRPLMTSSEIKECKDALVFCGANRALRLSLHPYYSSRLKSFLSPDPFVPKKRSSNIMPPLIQFD